MLTAVLLSYLWTLVAVGSIVVAYVHDRYIVWKDFNCFERKIKGVSDTMLVQEAATKCHILLYESDLSATRAWWDGERGWALPSVWTALLLLAIVFGPLMVVSWIAWVLEPPRAP